MKQILNLTRSILLIPIVIALNVGFVWLLSVTLLEWYASLFNFFLKFSWYVNLFIFMIVGGLIFSVLDFVMTIIGIVSMLLMSLVTRISPHKIYAAWVVIVCSILSCLFLLIAVWKSPIEYSFWNIIWCIFMSLTVIGLMMAIGGGAYEFGKSEA